MNRQRIRELAGKTLDFVRLRKRDYVHTFRTPSGERVLHDLSKFCRANSTCLHTDPRMHAVLEGREDVWLRIQNHLHLTPEQLYAVFGGAVPLAPGGEDDA